MALQKMADNEELGNAAAHFFKSGNVLRAKENKEVEELKDLLPAKGPNNTNIEYDLWYSVGNSKQVKGFVYTDSMTNFMYIRPANSFHVRDIMQKAAQYPVTEEGERLFSYIQQEAKDKYSLKSRKVPEHKFVIFLPGTNIYNKVVDEDKVKRAIDQGAMLKMHPISASGLELHLNRIYGKDKIINKKLSGHLVLESADIVGCCSNSEMGLAALCKGKSVYLFDKETDIRTYTAIYEALKVDKGLSVKKFKSILSCPYSGLVSKYCDNPQDRVNQFFNYFEELTNVN